ncbi:sensor histidine kinase [Streptomyces lancefieldiae]|uniref:histidine kinase n=1 Tax=Streptomyces lancefieldiae TaxID=3075520 RepID=A0ABU3AL02_9ACTN|nr:sensor histidine kinase [Streptomyces sp. DSM 40712]MDT0610867.1 sensor histidine kinase [Streptomyces sp. DSM 40712]
MSLDRPLRTRRRTRIVDAVLAVVTWGLVLLGSTLDSEAAFIGPPAPAVALVAAVPSAALLWRRRHPRAVVAVTTACGTALAVIGSHVGFDFSPLILSTVLVAVFSLGLRTDQQTGMRYTAGTAAVAFAASMIEQTGSMIRPSQPGIVATILLSGAVAYGIRTRRDYIAAVEARAELAERTREEEARRRVGEERTRIARELHDIVAHHIALAHIEAGTASYFLRTKPDEAQKIIDRLADTTSDALRELKATIGLLRSEDDQEAPREPAPGLYRLPQLIASLERAGLTVHLVRRGEERPLSPGVDLTAYRIVQEALTNVTKHAGTPEATVSLEYTRTLVTITVNDNGPAQRQTRNGTGYGLIGMRERATSAGGHVTAGGRPGGGFEVRAELPVDPRGPDHGERTRS